MHRRESLGGGTKGGIT